jgi:hypothetical protein
MADDNSQLTVAPHYPLWVSLALAGGAASAYLPELISDTFAVDSIWLFFGWLASTLLIPFLLGFIHRRHSWLWGLLVLAGLLGFLEAVHGNEGGAQTPIGLALYAVLLLPVVASGLLGALSYRLYERHLMKS